MAGRVRLLQVPYPAVSSVLAATTLALAACGSQSSTDSSTPGGTSRSEFCATWEDASAGSDQRLEELLEHPPRGLEEPAAEAIEAERSDDPSDGEQAAFEIQAWVESNCKPAVARPGAEPQDRRVALAPDATLDGFAVCFASTGPSFPGPDDERAVLYGEIARDDPYTGPMLGVLWGPDGDHQGDGEPTPVRVRGHDGVAAPITVFQQVTVEELGTVIAWEEHGLSVGLYGRFFDRSRIAELVALAEQLEFVDGSFRFPSAALPPGYEPVFAGAAEPLAFTIPVGAEYQVQYETNGGDSLLTLTGRVSTPSEFEAFRFLTLHTTRRDLGGRPAVVGNAWSEAGPAIVTWQELDGFVVRLVGIGVSLDTVQSAATQTRELTRTEWIDLVQEKGDCYEND